MMTEAELHALVNEKVYELGRVLMLYHNPCDIRGNACRMGDPIPCCRNYCGIFIDQHEMATQTGDGHCKMLGPVGCTIRSAACKIWICKGAADVSDPRFVEALRHLQEFLRIYGLDRTSTVGTT
jgi:hypothetical protein